MTTRLEITFGSDESGNDILEFDSAAQAEQFLVRLRRWRNGEDVIVGTRREDKTLTLRKEECPNDNERDSLTGLPGRATHIRAISQAMSRGDRVAVAILDIDRLRRTNDSLGPDAGDHVIKGVAQRLKAKAEPFDWTLARLEGDKFSVLSTAGADSAQLIDEIAILCQPFQTSMPPANGRVTHTMTAGVALAPQHGSEGGDVLWSANVALDWGRRSRRGEVSMFAPSMRRERQRELKGLADARAALDEDRLVPFYQPKLSLASQRVVGWEALLRVRREHGHDTPSAIAPAMDDPELASRIGRAIRRRVFSDVAAWQSAGVKIGVVSVNASPTELTSPGFADQFLSELEEVGVQPSSIGIEVTETAIIGGASARISKELRQLKSRGVIVALDDFGTGYGSMVHVMDFPLDAIKIDRSFVASLEVSHRARAIVGALATLTRKLGLEMVAEGVETQAQLQQLRDLGCDEVQGYLIGRPAPFRSVNRFLNNQADDDPPET